jgi:DNA primase large subunit
MNLLFSAKYPFTKEARNFVKQTGLKLADIDKIEDEILLERVKERVSQGIKGKIESPIGTARESVMQREILSYPLAKILVSLIKKRNLLERYAKAEAELALRFMRREEGEVVKGLAEEMKLEINGEKLPVFTYLNYLPKGKEWKLTKVGVEDGWVKLDEEGIRRVLSEKLRQNILNDLPVPVEQAPKIFIFFADELSSSKEFKFKLRKDIDLGPVDIEAFPPCIRNIYTAAKSGHLLPHDARFVLGTFLSNIGFGVDQVVDVFRTIPNFNEHKTRITFNIYLARKDQKQSIPQLRVQNSEHTGSAKIRTDSVRT